MSELAALSLMFLLINALSVRVWEVINTNSARGINVSNM